MSPLNIILFGKSGSGKGTQAQLLVAEYELHIISTGELLREYMMRDAYASRKLRGILSAGSLAPSWLVFSIWLRKLEELQESDGLLFEGAARQLSEAQFLDGVLEWYGRKLIAFYIDISDAEALRRLMLRGRHDDTDEAAIRKRLAWFQSEVLPVIDHYDKRGGLFRINGEQSIEAVHQEILSHLPPPRHHG